MAASPLNSPRAEINEDCLVRRVGLFERWTFYLLLQSGTKLGRRRSVGVLGMRRCRSDAVLPFESLLLAGRRCARVA